MTLDAIEKEESKKRNQGLLPENFDLVYLTFIMIRSLWNKWRIFL